MGKTIISDVYGIEVDHDCECSWCHKLTRRLDLELEVPCHYDCSCKILSSTTVLGFMKTLSTKI